MQRALKVLGTALAVLYPLLVLWVLNECRDYLRLICLAGMPVLVLVCLWQYRKSRKPAALVNPLIALLLFALVAITDAPCFFMLYPIIVTGIFLMHFTASLVTPPTVVEKLAVLSRAGEPLPAEGVAYCRKVTRVWICFFCFNIVVSAATALSGNWLIWSVYNGFISYLLMGMLMLGEWIVRRHVQPNG